MLEQGNRGERLGRILIDFIVFSSMQLNDPTRGFSFRHDGPLDMRMNVKSKSVIAYDLVNKLDEATLSKIIRLYGEDQRHRKIARCIHQWRSTFGPIPTTTQLANIIKLGLGGRLVVYFEDLVLSN